MVYDLKGKNPVKNVSIPVANQLKPSLTEPQVIQLAKWAMIIEDHYKKAMDIEFALDGRTNELFIIQARPETVQSQKNSQVIEKYKLDKKGRLIISGQSVGSKIGAGITNRMMSVKDINSFKPGQVLVTDMTDPDWEPIMKIASAIVTDKGGRTCHAAIVSRELGIPCVVGTEKASQIIKSGRPVTIDCASGEDGYVYEGILPFKVNKTDIKDFRKPKTKIMMNIGEPDLAFSTSFTPNDGVGLARLEFIINNYIKIHPLALINYNKIKDPIVKREIDRLTVGYKNKSQYFVDRLAQGMARISAAFIPRM